MPTYTFSAAKRDGQIIKGEREAENALALARALKQEDLFLLEAREKGSQTPGRTILARLSSLTRRIHSVRLADKIFFARNLAVMIKAGLALPRALDAIIQQTANPGLKKIATDVNSSVIKGNSFAQALKPHEKVFGELFVNMVAVGETTGKLALVLTLVSNQLKKDYELRKQIQSAMIYPIIVILALLGIGALMMVYVIPSLAQTIKELDVELPLTTRAIIAASDFLGAYGLWVLAATAAGAAGAWRLARTPAGKRVADRIILRAPLLGGLAEKFNTARFSRILAYQISAGVPIVKGLEITSRVLGNSFYRDAVLDASNKIQKGRPLAEILQQYPNLFGPILIQMVRVGEETGNVARMLLRLAIFFEGEVNATTKNLSVVVEPVLIIFIGAVVGFFALSVLQPIYSSLGNIR